jgi:hypothetical protein
MGYRIVCTALLSITAVATFAKPAMEHEVPDGGRGTAPAEIHHAPIVHHGEKYSVKFEPRSRKTVLSRGPQKITLESVKSNFDPFLVGAERVIGLLPEALQVYRGANILVYVSAVRTSGGNGSGQCGSGSEVFLKFLDIGTARPKIKASLLVASCERSIELDDQDLPNGILGAVSTVGDRLSIRFLSYGSVEGSPVALVSRDFQQLEFQ